jgi:ribosome maturation factor RimP
MENNFSNIIDDFFTGSDFVLIDFKQKGNKGSFILEVYIDKRTSFGIDEIAEANRNLRKILEEKNLDKGILKIIVSSPGAENPFKFFWQMEKHIGRELELILKTGETVTGKLEEIVDFEKEKFQIQIKEKKEIKSLNFLFGELSEAKIKLSFKK